MGEWLDVSCLCGVGGDLGLVVCVLSCNVRHGGGEWDFEGGCEDPPPRSHWVRNGEQLWLRDGVPPYLVPTTPQVRGQWGAGQWSGGWTGAGGALPLQKQRPTSDRDGAKGRSRVSRAARASSQAGARLPPGPSALHRSSIPRQGSSEHRLATGPARSPGAAGAPHCPTANPEHPLHPPRDAEGSRAAVRVRARASPPQQATDQPAAFFKAKRTQN